MEIKVEFEPPVVEAEAVADAEVEAETVAEAEAEADVVDEQTQPVPSMLVIGGALHVACASHGATEVNGAFPLTFSTLTRTGITAPVLRLNLR